MSFVTTRPEALTATAGQLAAIGSAMTASNSAVAQSVTGLVPAAADEVSALTAAAFTAHGVLYKEIGAQAVAMHQLFVATLQNSAGSYAATDAANAASAR
ncbi:PE family protein [Mycobacterium sp. UM_CSW]|uniref:PE family protein n=1 Tax=Mycobacterium sp. UM_CSW TaxID=1370119 RepID=UPI0003F57062|nr:PE family protein [Mycobacterium sp. UM_CSW]